MIRAMRQWLEGRPPLPPGTRMPLCDHPDPAPFAFPWTDEDLVWLRHVHDEYDAAMANLRSAEVSDAIFSELAAMVRSHAPTSIVFKHDEPQRLAAYIGQRAACETLSRSIAALEDHELVPRHRLLTGLPGFGKTLLAKVVGAELQARAATSGRTVDFVETYAANLNSIRALDDIVRRFVTGHGTVWFIDEIHVLDEYLATKIYLLMEEGRYPFEGSATATPIPDVMILGATTDYGALHGALKRRFGESLMLRPLSEAELVQMARTLGYPITEDAIPPLVERCAPSGAPHELKTLFGECVVFAKAQRAPMITPDIVHEVCSTYGIDRFGLRPIDRQVLETLRLRPRRRARTGELIGYGASEHDLCMTAGLDVQEFRDVIRPRLLVRRLLEVRSGIGLMLTDTALTLYPPTCASSATGSAPMP